VTSSTSSSETLPTTLPNRATQLRHFGKLALRILVPLLLVGVLVCLGLDWLVRKQLIEQTPSHGAAKLYRIQEPHPGEIPIIGSSRALCSFIPDSIGPNVYNYGLNGAGFAVMDLFLEHILSRKDTTPIVLNLDYEMFYYQMGDINSYLPHTDLPGVRPLLQRTGYYSAHMEIPGIRYYGAVDAFMKDNLNERLQLTKSMNKGAVIDKSPFNAQQFAVLVTQREDTVLKLNPFPKLVNKLFERIRGHRDRRFVLVVAPYHESYRASIFPENLAQADSLLAELALEPNVVLLDWDTHDWPDDRFTNTTHVNLAGAIACSHMLRAALYAPAAMREDTLARDSLPVAPAQPIYNP
jgi:hypothetical protein